MGGFPLHCRNFSAFLAGAFSVAVNSVPALGVMLSINSFATSCCDVEKIARFQVYTQMYSLKIQVYLCVNGTEEISV